MNTNAVIYVDKETKDAAEFVLAERGMSLATAINYVLRGFANGTLEFHEMGDVASEGMDAFELYNINQQAMLDAELVGNFLDMALDEETPDIFNA